MDFIEPSKIQSLSFPLIMKEPRLSLVAKEKNGCGKACVFGLGLLSSLDENSINIQASCFSPNSRINYPNFRSFRKNGEKYKYYNYTSIGRRKYL